ncbi:MAG: uroporphyrinogen-III C-methyltransferase [Gemmataceae bacterium]|nr:uroporphyrinogen-III C-methyltransferase [Gemmataceae bacterium]
MAVSHTPTGFVSLVGAGPGHPGLITLRAVECLRRADLVLYDKLVPAAMLDHAPPGALRRCVTELAATHAERCGPIHDAMIAAARQGRRVVRLKGGDPLVFGRGGEEAHALRAAGIPFEIIPGVTAALGAAAFAGIPLTDRASASAVAFITGHEQADKPETLLDWPALARFPGTLAIYMGMARLDAVVRSLIEAGKSRQTPAAAVQDATLGTQRTVSAALSDLPEAARAAGLAAPAVILVGPVASHRSELAWFENLPLFSRRILVTRPRQQAGALVERLIELGAVPVVLPTVEIREPVDWAPVDAALRRLADYDWLAFTSANGVQALFARLWALGFDIRALGKIRLAAIGPKTADALRAFHLEPDLVPAKYQSEDLAAALRAVIQPGQRVLLARADRGREILRELLAGHCQVEQVAVYAQADAVELAAEVIDQLRRGDIDCITLTSANIARALLTRLDDTCLSHIRSGRVKLATISPVTSAAVDALGLPVAAEATTATMEGVVQALIDEIRGRG